MAFSFMGSYRFRWRNISSATAILAVVYLCAKLVATDVLTLGYTMVVPVFIFLSALFEDARTDRGGLRGLRAWIETLIAAGSAAGVGYLGYRLWLLGF